MHIYSAPDTDTEGAGGRVSGEETRGCGGAVPGNAAGQGVGSRTPGAEDTSPCIWGADGIFGGIVIAKAWGGAAGCSGSSLGVGGAAHSGKRSQQRKAGVPTASTGSQAPTLRQGQQWRCGGWLYTPPPPGAGEREGDGLGQ